MAAVLTMVAIVTIAFLAVHVAPGTPFLPRGDHRPLDPASIARLRVRFGLDRPLGVQYLDYLRALLHGEFGESFSQHRPVAAMLATALPNTLILAGTALVIDLLLGFAIGVFQAAHAGTSTDTAVTTATLFASSLPAFWLGLVLLLVFGEWLRWFPVGGIADPVLQDTLPRVGRWIDALHHLALPALTLGLIGAATTARFQRAAMLDALGEGFIRTAHAKGIPVRRVLWRHAARNALLPWITLAGMSLPFLVTGAVVIETVFAWPGVGKLAADAVAARDYPVVIATTLIAGVAVVLGNTLADLFYGVADPRLRVGRGS